jgi:hypothetical protein
MVTTQNFEYNSSGASFNCPPSHPTITASVTDVVCELQGRRIPLQGRDPHRRGHRSRFPNAAVPANVVDY